MAWSECFFHNGCHSHTVSPSTVSNFENYITLTHCFSPLQGVPRCSSFSVGVHVTPCIHLTLLTASGNTALRQSRASYEQQHKWHRRGWRHCRSENKIHRVIINKAFRIKDTLLWKLFQVAYEPMQVQKITCHQLSPTTNWRKRMVLRPSQAVRELVNNVAYPKSFEFTLK